MYADWYSWYRLMKALVAASFSVRTYDPFLYDSVSHILLLSCRPLWLLKSFLQPYAMFPNLGLVFGCGFLCLYQLLEEAFIMTIGLGTDSMSIAEYYQE